MSGRTHVTLEHLCQQWRWANWLIPSWADHSIYTMKLNSKIFQENTCWTFLEKLYYIKTYTRKVKIDPFTKPSGSWEKSYNILWGNPWLQNRIYICICNEIVLLLVDTVLEHEWSNVSSWHVWISPTGGKMGMKQNLTMWEDTHEGPSPHVVCLWNVLHFIASLPKHLWSPPKRKHVSPKIWHLE